MIETVLKGGKVQRKPVWLKKGDDLEDRSGGLAQYEGHTVADIDARDRTLTFTNGLVLDEGRVVGDVDEAAVRRVQIRETIRAHLDRERLLFPRGIKVLSLFFIDEVAKYRRYDDDGAAPGEYAAMFEEEYAAASPSAASWMRRMPPGTPTSNAIPRRRSMTAISRSTKQAG